MNVFLAARWEDREFCKVLAKELEEAGYHVTSRWYNRARMPEGHEHDAHNREAVEDCADIEECDWVVALDDPSQLGWKESMRDFQLGFAVARGKRVFSFGDMVDRYWRMFTHTHCSRPLEPTTKLVLSVLDSANWMKKTKSGMVL